MSDFAQKASLSDVEQQIYSQRKHVRYDIRDLTFEVIIEKYNDSLDAQPDDHLENKRFNLIYIPEYQRDFTWDEKRQSKFIESLVLGLPIPFIFVAENKDSSWEIVDGSQRIRTMHAFYTNTLKLSGLESLTTLNGFSFSELDKARQGKIANTAIRIIVLSEETTDDIKKEMFERINRGSDLLKPMEKRKGIYLGKFSAFIYDYCKRSEQYRDLAPLDKWIAKRQEHEELLLRFFALSEKEAYKSGVEPGIATYLDKYLDKKNKELEKMSPEEVQRLLDSYEDKINRTLARVEKYFPYGFRCTSTPQTKRSVFEAIAVGTWLTIEKNLQVSDVVTKQYLNEKLQQQDFRQYTHVANELHKQRKLQGRVDYIYNALTVTQI